jgi:hypothetical protein
VGARGRKQQDARNYQNLYKCSHARIYRKRRASPQWESGHQVIW